MSELHEHDDSTLLDDFRDTRSEAAFTELVRRHLPLVFNVALRRLGSAAVAEEAAQHAFARLAAKAAAVARHPERLRAWLHRTAYFEASTLARKETRLSRLPVKPEPNIEPMNRPEIYDRLDEALNKLPELDRELVLRHCCGGEDYRRMAAAVGKSEAACQKRVERALARLGQGLGGARTAGVVFAAFAATNMKSQAMPAAERVAAAALKYHSATGSVVGALSGMNLAACAALALAGSAAAWPRNEPPPAPPAEVRSVAARARTNDLKAVAKSDEPLLAPRPVSITRSLDEILETIQAGRFAPLVEFLPNATVADLRAIIAEDDFYEYGETDGKEHFGTARNLALLRWTEIDPEGAFRFGNARDKDQGGYFLGDSAAVLAKWLQADPGAAAKALGTLPVRDRIELAGMIDSDAANLLAAADPRLAWVVAERHDSLAPVANSPADAERILAGFLSGGQRNEPTSNESYWICEAFQILADQDPAGTISRAELIPWPDLRTRVLSVIYQAHPPKSSTLAPGELRAKALVFETEQLMTSDPEAAIGKLLAAAPGGERDAIYQAVSLSLAGSDPWRLLEIMSSLRGHLSRGGDALERALEFAGKDNPQRALAKLPDIAARYDSQGETSERMKAILSGWLQKDPAAAIRWAAKADIRLESDALEKATGGTAPILNLLTDENQKVRWMAQQAMTRQVRDGLVSGTAKDLLVQMPQPVADEILFGLAINTWSPRNYDEALRIAMMASPAARQKKILPEIAVFALQDDPDHAVTWLKSLPAADQQAVVAGVGHMLLKWDGDNAPEIRRLLNQLTP